MRQRDAHILLDPANFWSSLLTLLLIGIASGLGTELVKDPSSSELWVSLGVTLAIVAFLGLLLSRNVLRALSRRHDFIRLEIRRHVPRAKVLIVFVSKGPGSASARDAAFYHAEKGDLRELWLITSTEAGSDADRVATEVLSRFPSLVVHPTIFVSDIYSLEEAKGEVENLRKKSLRAYESEREVMCDFTGLTKHMSAGMILACAPRDARLQYMHPKRFLPDGRADPEAGPSEPVEIHIAYQLNEDDD